MSVSTNKILEVLDLFNNKQFNLSQMILTIKEDFDRELGTSLPMHSRAGKSTIPQHLCFNNAPGNKKEFHFEKKDEKNDIDELGLLLGDKKA